MTNEEKIKWGTENVSSKLSNLSITCDKCQEVFQLKPGGVVTTDTNDRSRFQTSCPKCNKCVDFVIVYPK